MTAEPADTNNRQSGMYAVNPVFIARNHLVEQALESASNEDDFGPFHTLMDILARPHEYDKSLAVYATPPRDDQVVRQTFCGT